MVKILAGAKGEGKTKRLIEMANEASKVANGTVVFIDDDNSQMYNLHYSVRFVETKKFIMEDPTVFEGFICGILSQNSDIEHLFVDGLNQLINATGDDKFVKFIQDLDEICKEANTDITLIVSRAKDTLPAEIAVLAI